MKYLDRHPDILKWNSEELAVKYISPKDNRIHRYYPDLIIQKKLSSGDNEVIMIEIKPSSQCGPPKQGKTKKAARRYLRECMTWAINSAKWEAAQIFCKQQGWSWKIMTEKDLGVTYGKKRMKK